MKTIQLALGNSEYAKTLQNLLLRDGTHRVYLVDRPDRRLDGVIVIDGNCPENLPFLDGEPERFVVIMKKGSDHLSKIWEAGVRHVLFDGDPPNTAQLAIIAAELRLPLGGPRNAKIEQREEAHHLSSRHPFSIIDLPRPCGRCRSSIRDFQRY